jgi:hypothetical protein
MSIAKLFLRIDDLIMQAFNARVNFFQRILAGTNSDASLGAMSMDRGHLFPRAVGWNADFGRMVEGFVDFQHVNLANLAEVEQARDDLRHALSRRRYERFSTSNSAFVLEIFPNLTIPIPFLQHLANLPHESIRIVLIFFANMFQFTYFRSSNLICAFCQFELSSPHMFQCQGVAPNPICNWSAFISDVQSENFTDALDRLFLILQRWATLTTRFQPSFSAHVNEYFEQTAFQNRRSDPIWFSMSSSQQ